MYTMCTEYGVYMMGSYNLGWGFLGWSLVRLVGFSIILLCMCLYDKYIIQEDIPTYIYLRSSDVICINTKYMYLYSEIYRKTNKVNRVWRSNSRGYRDSSSSSSNNSIVQLSWNEGNIFMRMIAIVVNTI